MHRRYNGYARSFPRLSEPGADPGLQTRNRPARAILRASTARTTSQGAGHQMGDP
jgi:hypothetical protein